jgi:hypothetical protein
MVIDGIIAHRAVGARNDAFATARAPILVDQHDTGHRILFDCLGIDGTGPQASRTRAVLACDRQEIESWGVRAAEPHDTIAILAGPQSMLGLARRLATLAADASFEVDHQGQSAHCGLS